VEDEARAVAPSERQARPGGRGNVSAIVLDSRPQRRADEPTVASEPDGCSDAVGGAREIGTAVGLGHAVQGHRPGEPSLDADLPSRAGVAAAADESRFEHHPAGPLLRPGLRGQERQTQQQQLSHRDGRIPRLRVNRPVEAETAARVRNRKVGFNVMQERTDRPVALDRPGCQGVEPGRSRPPLRRPRGWRVLWSSASKRRLTGLPARDRWCGSDPWRAGGEV